MQGRRAPHDVDERCTSTPHTARKRTALARTARAGTAGAHNASMGSASAHNASMHSKRMYSRYTQREHGGHKHDNAGMHSASTKHGPGHPQDVDDDDERMSHDLSERCTSAPHAQHEGAQLEHAPHGHAQQAWARARTCRRQTDPVLSSTIWPSVRSHVSLFDCAALLGRVRVRPSLATYSWIW